ncbi:hypothetical protein [Streptomyces californicus]|uniref:hypothetical protein n=1 Tax=Streptomyces californicus TaxID=67351 RepID=UPI0033C68DD9
MVTRPATQWAKPTDDVVLYRAVIDHTSQCAVCVGRPTGCPIAQRLCEMARKARNIVREHREVRTDRPPAVRVGADTGTPTGPHCRAAELSGQPAVHLDCRRPTGACSCYCHRGGPPSP